jgi:hypothetical protein
MYYNTIYVIRNTKEVYLGFRGHPVWTERYRSPVAWIYTVGRKNPSGKFLCLGTYALGLYFYLKAYFKVLFYGEERGKK